MHTHGRSLAILVIVVLIGLLFWFLKSQNFQNIPQDTTPITGEETGEITPQDFGDDITTALFTCDQNKRMVATFKERGVLLNLSDGRSLALPQTISASGARYATKDENFVFWNKGDTAFIQENNKTTYSNCNTVVGEFD